MQNQTLLVVVDVLSELLQIAIYLGALIVSYYVLKQQGANESLGKNSNLVKVIVFIIMSYLLYSSGMLFVNNILYFPRGISNGNGLTAGLQCVGSLVGLGGLVFGIKLLLSAPGKP